MNLPEWLHPPEVENPEEALRSVVAHWVLLTGIIVLIPLVIASAWLGDELPAGMPVYGGSLIGALVAFLLLHRGYSGTAGGLIIAVAWGFVMWASMSQGGVSSPQLSTMVLVVMLAGFLWNSRAGIGLAVFTSACLLVMAYSQSEGLLKPDSPVPTPLATWSALTSVLAIAAVFLHLALRTIDSSRIEVAEKSVRLKEEMERRAEVEESLRTAQKLEALGRLTGGIAHDFNNILTVLLAQSTLLVEANQERAPLDEESLAAIKDIQSASERAAALTRRLLAFARRQVGRPENVDPNLAIARLEPMLRRLIPENIQLHTVAGPDVCHVQVDVTQLEQVLLNLVLNGRDAMPAGGELRIQTSTVRLDEGHKSAHADPTPGDHAEISVSDTGMGIASEHLERVFDPFFTTKSMGHGTGLGLATVHGIVKQAGGHIAVESEPGHGTTFRVYLPASRLPEQTVEPTLSWPKRGAAVGGSETILLCEDEDDVRTLVETALRSRGYDVLSAHVPERALEIASTDPAAIDLLLTDVVMPGMSGPALATSVASLRHGVRVLFMSGYPADEIEQEGASDANLLEKPFTPEVLLGRVRETLDAPEG